MKTYLDKIQSIKKAMDAMCVHTFGDGSLYFCDGMNSDKGDFSYAVMEICYNHIVCGRVVYDKDGKPKFAYDLTDINVSYNRINEDYMRVIYDELCRQIREQICTEIAEKLLNI